MYAHTEDVIITSLVKLFHFFLLQVYTSLLLYTFCCYFLLVYNRNRLLVQTNKLATEPACLPQGSH